MAKAYDYVPSLYYYSFGFYDPVLTLRPGDRVTTTTLDARSLDEEGREAPAEQRHRIGGKEFKESNPVVGPFGVEGAEPGDTLVVRIETIRLNRDFAASRHNPGFGAMGIEDIDFGPTGLNEPLPFRRFEWKLDREGNLGILELEQSRKKRVEIPLHPFLGCIGTAPRFGEVISTMAAAEHGGNMDCVETKEGASVYLPVFADGACLFLGDVHAAQGDGEICGSALETTAEVTLSVDLIKRTGLRWPRMEDEEFIMTAPSARPLIDAFRTAQTELIRWMCSEYGFDCWEAFQLVSQAGRTRVGNVVDPKYTVVAKILKSYLV